jgi:hypothetical protein
MDMGSFIYGWFLSSILFALVFGWLVMKQQDQQDAYAKEIDNLINSLKNDKPDFVKVAEEVMKNE